MSIEDENNRDAECLTDRISACRGCLGWIFTQRNKYHYVIPRKWYSDVACLDYVSFYCGTTMQLYFPFMKMKLLIKVEKFDLKKESSRTRWSLFPSLCIKTCVVSNKSGEKCSS